MTNSVNKAEEMLQNSLESHGSQHCKLLVMEWNV